MSTTTTAPAARRCKQCKTPEGGQHKLSCSYARYPSQHPGGPVWEPVPAPAKRGLRPGSLT